MIRLLLSLIPLLAQNSDGISVPFSAVAAVVTVLGASVAFVFKVLIGSYERRIAEMAKSQEERVSEMAASNDRIAAQVAAMARALDRTNRLHSYRIISNSHAAPDIKDEVREISKEIDSEELSRRNNHE